MLRCNKPQREGQMVVDTAHAPHIRNDYWYALPHVRRSKCVLYVQAPRTLPVAQGHERGASHNHTRRSPDYRENLQEQHPAHHQEEPPALVDEQECLRPHVQDYRHETEKHIRWQGNILRHRRRQARRRHRSIPAEGRLPLRHRLRPHRDLSPAQFLGKESTHSRLDRYPRKRRGTKVAQHEPRNRRRRNCGKRPQRNAWIL